MAEVTRSRWLFVAGAAGAVIVVVVLALAREPVQLDPNTPEGTVQEYLQAISDEDYDRAFEVLDPESFGGCDAGDLARHTQGEQFSANLEKPKTSNEGTTAVVAVNMRFGEGGPFGSGWESWETFSLINRDGFWWITEEAWPYFGFDCRGDI